MKEIYLSQLRDPARSPAEFRRATALLAALLAAEAGNFLESKQTSVQTPFEETKGALWAHGLLIVPILRAGLALLPPFLELFPHGKIGLIGLRRERAGSSPEICYRALPSCNPEDEVLLLDPMIATGRTGCRAIRALLEAGAQEERILLISILSAPEGVQRIETEFPSVRLHVAQEDRELNEEGFILPGIGDFGDRYFDA